MRRVGRHECGGSGLGLLRRLGLSRLRRVYCPSLVGGGLTENGSYLFVSRVRAPQGLRGRPV